MGAKKRCKSAVVLFPDDRLNVQINFASPRNLLILAMAALLAIVVGMAAMLVVNPGDSDASIKEQVTGKALIGGPFTMVDHTGTERNEQDILGQHALIYFGYTFCPDACPTALGQMTTARSLLPDGQQDLVKPVFVTLDPERDTVEAIADYVALFSDDMLGLTGSVDQVDHIKSVYRVYSQKVDDAESTDYLVDHSSYIYLMDPSGEYIKHFSHNDSVETIRAYLNDVLG